MKSIFILLSLYYLVACTATDERAQAKSLAPTKPGTEYTLSSGGPLKPEQAVIKLNHVDLSITVYPKKQAIAGLARLTIAALATTHRIKLDLDTRFDIHEVSIDGHKLDKSRYTNVFGLLSIELDNPLLSGQQLELSIDYSGIGQVAKSPPWKGGFIWDASADGQPWVATAVQFEGCDLFWPCIDHPLREPQSLDMHIKVPAALVAAANGRLVSIERQGDWSIYHWQSLRPVNTYAVSLNIGPYEQLESSYNSRYGYELPLRYWYLPTSREDAEKLFAEFPRVLDFFESVIGPYPFYDEKMGVVETPYLGMEHQTINAYGNNYKVGRYGFDWLLHHEFAHEWFGNQLTHNSQDDMWLHEGFGIYMQPLYAQFLHGDLAYHSYLYQQRLNIVNAGPLVSGKSRNEKDLENDGVSEDVYYKGSLVLHSLRELIGDKAFFAATTELVYGVPEPKPGNFAPRNASTEDFITLVEQKVGKELDWFFQVYLYQAKLPELLMERRGNNIEFRWLVENDLPFPMPLEVSIDGQLVTLDMADKRGVVEADENAVIIADPHSKILRHQPHFDRWRKTGRQYRDN